MVVGANHCSHGDVNSGVPRAHQRVFAASLTVFDVVCFMPDFSGGGDNKDTLLPAVTLGFRRLVMDAGVAQSYGHQSASRGFLFLNSLRVIALAAASSICLHSSIFFLNASRDNSVPWHSEVACTVSLRTPAQSVTRLFISDNVAFRLATLAAAIADGSSPSRCWCVMPSRIVSMM